jgi:hypothetical protein
MKGAIAARVSGDPSFYRLTYDAWFPAKEMREESARHDRVID